MTKAFEARDRLRTRIEAVLRERGGFEVAPYLEAIAIEQWLYGDPDFMASLIEENALSTEAATFVSEIVRGRIVPAATKRAVGVHPGAALFVVAWLMTHHAMKKGVAVERAALELNVSAGHLWFLLEEFETADLDIALTAVQDATQDDLDGVIRNARRPPVFGGRIWISTRVGL